MDDVRAVMDAVGAERAAVIGVSEGGPMCTLFAATHPDRCLSLVTLGAYARRNWAPDYPIGRRAEQDGWLRPTPEQWGTYAARRFLAERAPSIADDDDGDRVVRVLPRPRGQPVGRGLDHRHERGDRRPPRARRPCGCRRSSCIATRSTCARPASTWASGCRARAWSAVPGTDHLPWEGDQESVLAAIETFFGELGQTVVEPGLILTTVLEAEVPDSEPGLAHSAFARFRGRAARGARPAGSARASTARPARSGARARSRASCPSLRAGVHTGECELRDDGGLTGAALEIAAGVAGAAQAGPDPRHLHRPRPRRRLGHGVRRARHGHARERRLASVRRPGLNAPKGDSPALGGV